MATQEARERAAQAWRKTTTEHLKMIPELAEAFAESLDRAWAEAEQLHVQLAGCAVAAQGGISLDQVAIAGDYGWSPAYQDVLELRKRYEHLVELLKKENPGMH